MSTSPSPPPAGEFAQLTAAVWNRRQRLMLALVSLVARPLILALGGTYRIELPHGLPAGVFTHPPEPAIYAFWHRELLPIAWFSRGRGFGILVSQHFDGEWIARAAAKMGYHVFRGSSTRGGAGAMAEMTLALQAGGAIGLTVDGPRGPRFRAKAGAIRLACDTGVPIYAIHAEPENCWTLRSWDQFQIPKPFSRVRGTWAGPLYVPPDAGAEEMERKRLEMEQMLNDLRARGAAPHTRLPTASPEATAPSPGNDSR